MFLKNFLWFLNLKGTIFVGTNAQIQSERNGLIENTESNELGYKAIIGIALVFSDFY